MITNILHNNGKYNEWNKPLINKTNTQQQICTYDLSNLASVASTEFSYQELSIIIPYRP